MKYFLIVLLSISIVHGQINDAISEMSKLPIHSKNHIASDWGDDTYIIKWCSTNCNYYLELYRLDNGMITIKMMACGVWYKKFTDEETVKLKQIINNHFFKEF